MISLYPHQEEAIKQIKNGSIVKGGVGTGKSRTSLAYYYSKEKPKQLYIITTAKKRDSNEWLEECEPFGIENPIIDSWNNIGKYLTVKDAFFIFDEQRLVGSGAWVKHFIKISKINNWILLTATPGDSWSDYIPVFVANGFYKNRTEFLRRHAVYSKYAKYPKVERFMETKTLEYYRNLVVVNMEYQKHTTPHHITVDVCYDKELYKKVMVSRWNVYTNEPIESAAEVCYTLRKIVNSDDSRIDVLFNIFRKHQKLIIFYNFDYELNKMKDAFAELGSIYEFELAEWNGHKHQSIPTGDSWVYLVQYTAGAEGWNCITTDTIVFYSQNYSYKIMVQSAGRTDRLNTKFKDLFYYHLVSKSNIDIAIARALKNKKNFNQLSYFSG